MSANADRSLDFRTLDDRDALYYLSLDFEPVAEPHPLFVLPFCGLPDPPPSDAGRCPFHGSAPKVLGFFGPECPQCERERAEADGCRCGGAGTCEADRW